MDDKVKNANKSNKALTILTIILTISEIINITYSITTGLYETAGNSFRYIIMVARQVFLFLIMTIISTVGIKFVLLSTYLKDKTNTPINEKSIRALLLYMIKEYIGYIFPIFIFVYQLNRASEIIILVEQPIPINFLISFEVSIIILCLFYRYKEKIEKTLLDKCLEKKVIKHIKNFTENNKLTKFFIHIIVLNCICLNIVLISNIKRIQAKYEISENELSIEKQLEAERITKIDLILDKIIEILGIESKE